MSLTLSMIVKNEEALLPICLRSIKEFVDEIIIVDTGSADRTLDICRDMGVQVSHFTWIDDFAAARNYALSLVKTPWTIWLDADDIVLNPQLIKPACEFARRKRIKGMYGMYKQDESSYQRRLQVFKTDAYVWKGVVHESPVPKRPLTEAMYFDLTVLHRKPIERRPEAALKYLKILEDKDPENWFGIAESYRFLAVHPDDPANVPLYKRNAEELFFRAANVPNASLETRFISLFYCARFNYDIAMEEQDTPRLEHANRLLQLCHRLSPERAEPITLLGMVYEGLQNYTEARKLYETALKMPLYEKLGLVLKDYYRAIPKARLEGLKEKV